MALIVITIKDQDDGSCAVTLVDNPSVTPEQTEFTPAQHIGAAALNAIHRELNEKQNVITPTAQKLQLVGADELPL